MITIYALKCPMTNEIKYVGQTTKSLKERLWGHMGSPPNIKMREWITSLNSVHPIIEQISLVVDEIADTAEMFWIKYYRKQGIDLLNKNDKIDRSSFRRTKSYNHQQKTIIAMKNEITPTKTVYKFEVDMPETIYNELKRMRDGVFPKWSMAAYLNVFLEYAIPLTKLDSEKIDAECKLDILNDSNLSIQDKLKWMDLLNGVVTPAIKEKNSRILTQ